MKRTLSTCALLTMLLCCRAVRAGDDDPWKVDFRYAIPWWQTAICLPDDWQKTLVGKEGEMLYDFPGKFSDFKTRITLAADGPMTWVKQELASPRVPIVRTLFRRGAVEVLEEAFAVTPGAAGGQPPPLRQDVMLVHVKNPGDTPQTFTPSVKIESTANPQIAAGSEQVVAGGTRLVVSEKIAATEVGPQKLVLRLSPMALPGRGERCIAVWITRGTAGVKGDSPIFADAKIGTVPAKIGTVPAKIGTVPEGTPPAQRTVADAEAARGQAEAFWTSGRLPYDRIQVPDPGIQALIESSMRNIYQAREIKKGLPAFQVGPTCYRGLWIVDGSFLLEAATYFGCGADARYGIQYMMTHQRPDGGFTVMDKYWKESGIVLWAVTRHARLTGDKAWLEGVWPKLEHAVSFIWKLREQASADPKAPHFGLIPPGFPDGGLGGVLSEYTNVYWTLVGLHAVIDAARWLGKDEEAAGWQRQYDDFYAAFRKAADRDMQTDPRGNRYLPIVMLNAGNHLPQRAQWAFCHAVFPGKVFPADDPLVRGNMAMLEATECEGMVFGTGWADKGIWNYFASFYGHAWLWLGEGQKAARVLYAFANHASPLLTWREEQMPRGKGSAKVGDMPHNWASAEFVRLVRHLLVLERGNDLHLLEGMPAAWARPGAVTRLKDMPTEFGPLSLEVAVAADGKSARVRLETPTRTRPQHIVLHLGGWSGAAPKAVMELDGVGTVEKTVPIAAGKP